MNVANSQLLFPDHKASSRKHMLLNVKYFNKPPRRTQWIQSLTNSPHFHDVKCRKWEIKHWKAAYYLSYEVLGLQARIKNAHLPLLNRSDKFDFVTSQEISFSLDLTLFYWALTRFTNFKTLKALVLIFRNALRSVNKMYSANSTRYVTLGSSFFR